MKQKVLILLLAFCVIGCATTNGKLTEGQKIEKYNNLIHEGMKLYNSNEKAKALDVFLEAYSIDNTEMKIKGMIGLCYASLGKQEKGRKLIDEYLVNTIESDPFMYHQIAAAYGYFFNDPGKALELFDKAISANKDDVCWDYIQKGFMHIKMNNKDKAIEMFEKGYLIAKQQNDETGMRTASEEIKKLSF